MKENWIQSFIKSAGAILLVSALARFLIAASNAPFLFLPDSLLGIPLRYALLAIGGIELFVALVCLFGKYAGIQSAWLAWLATNYVVFQTGLFWMHCHPQATCIGSLTDPLHLSRGITGSVLAFVPVYLVLGSYTAWIWFWLENRRMETAEYFKMSCPSCGIHLRFDTRNLGQEISCPHCHAYITLRKPENLKMACFFCREHIEFPSHAIGQRIPCPHCEKIITLTPLQNV
jgi:predicted RNA-binding Zn-ribbon protein involved in translation (DUF1610 family)